NAKLPAGDLGADDAVPQLSLPGRNLIKDYTKFLSPLQQGPPGLVLGHVVEPSRHPRLAHVDAKPPCELLSRLHHAHRVGKPPRGQPPAHCRFQHRLLRENRQTPSPSLPGVTGTGRPWPVYSPVFWM